MIDITLDSVELVIGLTVFRVYNGYHLINFPIL